MVSVLGLYVKGIAFNSLIRHNLSISGIKKDVCLESIPSIWDLKALKKRTLN